MLDAVHAFAAWLQSWLSVEAGLLGLFASALLSATVLPGSSELVMVALVTAYPEQAWPAFAVATLGNVLGCAISFGMGSAARDGYERFQRVKVDRSGVAAQRLRRWGPPALFLSFLPLVGDAMVLAAGWMRLPFWTSLAWMAAGKAARYLVVVASLLGLLSLA